jgi:hypothetical protein
MYPIASNLKPILFFFIHFTLISLGNSWYKYFKVQIGGQAMQNYNLGGKTSNSWIYGGTEKIDKIWLLHSIMIYQ